VGKALLYTALAQPPTGLIGLVGPEHMVGCLDML
jgi:hypothetical protein